ncbi:molybdenum cofactor guanylyltransferase [Microbulbifer rhizosphaerae]|uniref:Molybdopterin-guanine dinucleotide biosynthesis protein A n=1 Tax=Microbulbifer rhizosphaerae TaxID=1562603 RepID=A0A7W4Z7E7_9GAMM|nr:molybdenum cofactor guanylyltransferase [Microbulbifer rhizosphaerae]MBB3059653.1 molybdopterin-guanine dinucleotide biosynthesis protein A [Microbulbifer rhizosphaerae]
MKVCPVILAGGQSRRMGRDKALLQLPGGQTLLQRAQSLLSSLHAAAGVEFLPPLVSGNRPSGIADSEPVRGPLGGLHAVAEHLRREQIACDALLAIPVDMPLLGAEQLEKLCAEGVGSGEGALCFGRCYLPLWLRLDESSRDCLQGAITPGKEASVKALVRELGGRQLEMPPGNWHINVNRPEEFAEIYGAERLL